jgi:hypothetical protein
VAKSKFDYSLLKPVENTDAEFQNQLKPVEEEKDPGEFLDNLPEPEGFWKKLPRNVLIGLTHAGRNLHNTPHDIVAQLESATKPFGDIMDSLPGAKMQKGKPLSEYLPNDTEDYSEVFGGNKDSKTIMDKIIQKGFEHAPEIIGGISALRSGLRKFPVTQKGAARQLKEAKKLINERGINNFQMNYPLLQETSPFLPKTHATGEMIQGIVNGEYEPAFALQSQLGQHARNLAKSPLAAERLLAPQARELKQLVLHEMEQALRSTGHHEIADLLKGGIKDYAKYMKFKEKAWPVLKKLGIPSTGLALLGLGVTKGKKSAIKLLEQI